MLVRTCICCALIGTIQMNGDGDVGYDLKIGNAIDVFANYGDISQVTQVISADYGDYAPLFYERNIRIFQNITYTSLNTSDYVDDSMSFLFCDTFDDLLTNYYRGFHIEGTDKPWKAFMGDWVPEEILRSLGLEYHAAIGMTGYCCFVLARLSKVHSAIALDGVDANVTLTAHVRDAVENMSGHDEADIRKFMTSYGTHYIDSFTTGNSMYQVFVYKDRAYKLLKRRMQHRKSGQMSSHDLRFYFSSFFLNQIGQVMVASGNKTVEDWAEDNLSDSQYLFSRPSLIKLYYNSTLLLQLNQILDNSALLKLQLKIMSPVFRNDTLRASFLETVDNELKLWEVNEGLGSSYP